MKVVVTSKENDIAVYHCTHIVEYDKKIKFINVKGNKAETNTRATKDIEIVSVYFEGGKS